MSTRGPWRTSASLLALGFAAVVAVACPSARAGASADDTIVREVMELSGLNAQLERVPTVVDASIAAKRAEINPADWAALRDASAQAFQPLVLQDAVFRAFSEEAASEYWPAVRQWLRSSVAIHLIQLEIRSSTAFARDEIKAEQAREADKPPEPERLSLLERIARATFTTELALQTRFALTRGLLATMPEDKRPADSELYASIRSHEPEIRQELMNDWVHIYRDVPLEDLRSYADFLDSDAGQWFNTLAMRAVTRALAEASVRIGTELAEPGKG